MLQELEQKATQLVPFLWIILAEKSETAKTKIYGILERIKDHWCIFPMKGSLMPDIQYHMTPKRMLLETYELLKPNADAQVVKDSFVYHWIIER